jgi:protein involved in polysaccharide export with SLBB domain
MINKYKHIVYVLFVSTFAFGYGQSIQELQKLKKEYEKFQKGQKQLQLPTGVDGGVDPTTGLPRQAQISPYQPIEIAEEVEEADLKYFGYEFFTRRDTVAFWENLPTPANYLLGPGDELVISLWGETQLRETYTISRDGKIYDEKVGLLNITGKTITEARQYLNYQFGRIYATLKGKKATTFMDVSLGELRSINVNFVGQVKYPGVYPIHPFSTVITGLIQAGGVDTTGSLRAIKIKRDGLTEETVDLYNYLIKGEISSNIQLRDQDIVVIPPRVSIVKIDSAVVIPSIYEAIPGETVYDLIQYAGGQKHDASETVGIHKIKPKSERTNGVSYEAYYVDFESTKLIPANNIDRIEVRHLFRELQQVEIIGQVKMPGVYHYYGGMTFEDLVLLGGGVNDSTFWKSIYHDQAEIIRRNPQTRYDEVIEVNLLEIIKGNGKADIALQNLDRVVIHANLNYFKKENVQILGEVKIPGDYPLLQNGESLQSLISRAGGFTDKSFEDGIEIYRDSLRVAWKNMNLPLMAGDSIVVREKPGTIFVTGEVYNPGLIEFDSRKSLKNYIDLAGGPTKNGDKNDVIVIYANGEVIPKKRFSSPKVKDGATIIVNQKEPTEPFDPTQFANTTLSLLSSLVTIIVLSKQL